MEVECKFKRNVWNKFSAEYEVTHQVLNESKWNKNVTFFGENIEESYHEQVRAIHFKKCVMKKLPTGLSKIFPSLRLLSVIDCGFEDISKGDLNGFKELKVLLVKNNELTFLPGDLFAENCEIEDVSFKGNKLIHVGANILKPLTKLKSADFRGNLRINYKFKAFPYGKNAITERMTDCSIKKLEKKIRKMEFHGLACSGGLSHDINKFISNDEFKNLKILINETEFKVHKFLLTARSPVLKELMKRDSNADSITLEHIPKEIFQHILDFIYDEKLPNNDVVLETYAAAAQLQIQELQDFAASRMTTLIDDENALKILFMANEYKNEDLKLKAFDHIKSFFPDKKLKTELASNPEAVRKLIAAKKEIERLVE